METKSGCFEGFTIMAGDRETMRLGDCGYESIGRCDGPKPHGIMASHIAHDALALDRPGPIGITIDIEVGAADLTIGRSKDRAGLDQFRKPNGKVQNVPDFRFGATTVAHRAQLQGAMPFFGYVSNADGCRAGPRGGKISFSEE